MYTEFPSYISPSIFPYETTVSIKEKIHFLNEYCALLHEEIEYHLKECEKLGYTEEDIDKIDMCDNKLEKDTIYYRIARIKSLQREDKVLLFLAYEIISEIPKDDPARNLLEPDVTSNLLEDIPYFNYNPKTETTESVKDIIFTEKNVRKWEAFAQQPRIEDLCEILRRIKNKYTIHLIYELEPGFKPGTREEIRHYKAEDLFYLTEEYEARRFIECCFVAAFDRAFPTRYEWLTPLDIDTAIIKYKVDVEFTASIEDECEVLRHLGYLEKHPDDMDHTDETRYRIKY